MPKFTLKSQRNDPYRTFKFRIKMDDKYVAGLSKCSDLNKPVEKVVRRGSGTPNTIKKLPGKAKSEVITLASGITNDTNFEDWANLVNNFSGDAAMSVKNFRKNIIIDVFNEANQKIESYQVHNCWVSEYQALPNLDAGANAVMIQAMKLENEGWERDTS